MPLIYAAADMPRHHSWQFDAAELPPHWRDWVAEYRFAFQEAGITADWIREHLDAPAHLPAADQEFLVNMRVAEHNNPDGAPFAQAGNLVMVYGAYMFAAARNTEPRQPRRRRAAPSSTTAQTTSPAADPITRSGDPASRFPGQAYTVPFLPEVWAKIDAIDLVEEFQQRVDHGTLRAVRVFQQMGANLQSGRQRIGYGVVDLALVFEGAEADPSLVRRFSDNGDGTAHADLLVPEGAEVAGVVVYERYFYGLVDLQLLFKDGTRSERAFAATNLSDYRHGGKDVGGRELVGQLPAGQPFQGLAVREQGSYGLVDVKLL